MDTYHIPFNLEKINNLKKYAKENRIELIDLIKMKKGEKEKVYENKEYSIIEKEYEIVYTIERQYAYGWCDHLSVTFNDLPKKVEEKIMSIILMLFDLTKRVICIDEKSHVDDENKILYEIITQREESA